MNPHRAMPAQKRLAAALAPVGHPRTGEVQIVRAW